MNHSRCSNTAAVNPIVILIRHAEVAPKWKGVCYGAMDVPLSDSGETASAALATRIINDIEPIAIYHSDLARTRILAELLQQTNRSATPVIADPRLRERNYGHWQGLRWDDAYASDPEHFLDLIKEPSTYRPPGGETTAEMQHRVVDWYEETCQRTRVVQPESKRQPAILAVSHSGPIAALAGHLLGLHARDWQPFTIGNLESVRIANGQVRRFTAEERITAEE